METRMRMRTMVVMMSKVMLLVMMLVMLPAMMIHSFNPMRAPWVGQVQDNELRILERRSLGHRMPLANAFSVSKTPDEH
eukprot:4075075-Pyramimonas_sp.AAC.1